MPNARRIAWIITAMCLAGCYTFEPARQVSTLPGTVIALDINDRGRVAMGGLVGPEVARIEGSVVSMDSSEYVLHVTGIQFLRGGEQAWRGETVHVKTEYVGSRYERHLSTVRTVLFGAVAVGAVAFIATKGLAGLGTGDSDSRKPDTSAVSTRVPRRP